MSSAEQSHIADRSLAGRRVLLEATPKFENDSNPAWNRRGEWPAHWISLNSANRPQIVAAYRLTVELPTAATVRVHITADERYRLYLNGELFGSGSERGDVQHWFFETYDLDLRAGANTIVAQVWSLEDESPFAQMHLKHGFLLCADDPAQASLLSTGFAEWQAKELSGYRFVNPQVTWGTGFNVSIDGRSYSWGWEEGRGEGWSEVALGDRAVFAEGANDKSPRHLLTPATLPAMANSYWNKARVRHVSSPPPGPTKEIPFEPGQNIPDEVIDWTRLIIGHPLTIPANSRRRVLLDLHDYVCAFPELEVSNGCDSEIRIHWQESLFDRYGKPEKGNRDEIDFKFFCNISDWDEGVGDSFVADGGAGRKFIPLWWQCGRYVEILVQTKGEALVLESLRFREDRYPFENKLTIEASDPRLAELLPLAFRTLQMCSHETYMDCPFYEQLQYIGDTRIQALVTYVTTGDDRLARKALKMFDWSRLVDGITYSRYPSRVVQIIPPFSLWWICMIEDFALWRGDREFVASLLAGARIVLDWFRSTVGRTGLVEAPEGWNFIDWVPGWHSGMPPGADDGASCAVNRQFELALRAMSRLESWVEEPEMASRHLRNADEIAHAIHRSFWSSKRGMYADDLAHSSFSEHAQALSMLTGALPAKVEQMVVKGLITEPDLARTTVYFSHYLFEAYAKARRTDLILSRMSLWFEHLGKGLKTIIESPEPTRSDCHAWGTHPLYHYVASFAGVRPAEFGGRKLTVRPCLGGLTSLNLSIPLAGEALTISMDGQSFVFAGPKDVLIV